MNQLPSTSTSRTNKMTLPHVRDLLDTSTLSMQTVVQRCGGVNAATPSIPPSGERVQRAHKRNAPPAPPQARLTIFDVIRLCNACGLRWLRNNKSKEKKKALSAEDQMFNKFTIWHKNP